MILEITELYKNFKGQPVLGPLNVTIHPGIFAVVGANGAGKTTLLRLLAGILTPTKGTVTLDGTAICNQRYRQRIGYKPQSVSSYSQTSVVEGLRYFALLKGIPNRLIIDRIDWVLETFKLKSVADSSLASISRGLRQLFFLAQAMLADPDILLLDEPLGGLSSINRLDILREMAVWATRRIVIISTHIISDIQQLNPRILVLSKGKQICLDTSQRLIDQTYGTVWEVELDHRNPEMEEVKSHYFVANIHTSNQKITLRIIADRSPHRMASLVQPTLEEAYLVLSRKSYLRGS